jgi:site-specific DNA recombinase
MTQKVSYLYAHKLLKRKIKENGVALSRGRKLFIIGILKINDYNELNK